MSSYFPPLLPIEKNVPLNIQGRNHRCKLTEVHRSKTFSVFSHTERIDLIRITKMSLGVRQTL